MYQITQICTHFSQIFPGTHYNWGRCKPPPSPNSFPLAHIHRPTFQSFRGRCIQKLSTDTCQQNKKYSHTTFMLHMLTHNVLETTLNNEIYNDVIHGYFGHIYIQ